MTIATLGIDLGKNRFHVVGLDDNGAVVERRSCSRTALMRYLARLPSARVAMEACAGAHFVARKAKQMGHDPHLLPAQYVRAYTKGQKNDFADAEAIAEAATRPTMREVAIKDVSQQELQLLHRQRSAWVGERTALANRIRAMLAEFGLVLPRGLTRLRRELVEVLEDGDNGVPDRLRALLYELWRDLRGLDERIEALTRELAERAQADPRGRMLLTVPGVGPVVATALLAALGDGGGWRRGRDFAAWLGLVPRQYTTGGRPRLLGISKRGNRYLRTLLIHGARSVLCRASRRDDALGHWLERLAGRRHRNITAVALANKLARIAWAVVARATPFDPRAAAA